MDISCCDIVAEANIIILFMKVMFILRISVFEWYVDVEWINGDGAAQPLPVIAMKNILTIHAEPKGKTASTLISIQIKTMPLQSAETCVLNEIYSFAEKHHLHIIELV